MGSDNKNNKKVVAEDRSGRKWYNRWIPRWVSLPLLIIMVFLVVMLFYGDNSYIKSNEYRAKINELTLEIQANRDSAVFYQRKARELSTDKETLEKIAREQYGMKRESEDVYITDIP